MRLFTDWREIKRETPQDGQAVHTRNESMAVEKFPLSDGRLYTGGDILQELRIRQERGYRTMLMPDVPDEELKARVQRMSGSWKETKARKV